MYILVYGWCVYLCTLCIVVCIQFDSYKFAVQYLNSWISTIFKLIPYLSIFFSSLKMTCLNIMFKVHIPPCFPMSFHPLLIVSYNLISYWNPLSYEHIYLLQLSFSLCFCDFCIIILLLVFSFLVLLLLLTTLLQ